MRRHYNQVDAQPRSHLENLDRGIPRHYLYFIAGYGLKLLMADPLKFSFRRSLGLVG